MCSALASAVRLVLPLLGVLLVTPAAAQTLFTTSDYRQDREHWTDPAYFNFNTAREFRNLHRNGTDERGSGDDESDITSPYAYRTSLEHYQAWLKAAGGGTKHTMQTLPDWDGHWAGNAGWLGGGNSGQHDCRRPYAAVPGVLRAAGESRVRRARMVGPPPSAFPMASFEECRPPSSSSSGRDRS